MNKTFFLIFIASCSINNGWNHQKELSSYGWSKLDQKFQACDLGTHQSPINLSNKKAKPAKQLIRFYYKQTSATMENNGYTLELHFDKKNYILFEKEQFFLKELHLHAKSEHAVNGVFYPAELHLVHQSTNEDILVVGIFIELADTNSLELNIFNKIPNKGERIKIPEVNLDKLSKGLKSHFYYQGSLSTPPCRENVHWIVYDKHLYLTEGQLELLDHYIYHNDRPLQKIKEHRLMYIK